MQFGASQMNEAAKMYFKIRFEREENRIAEHYKFLVLIVHRNFLKRQHGWHQ